MCSTGIYRVWFRCSLIDAAKIALLLLIEKLIFIFPHIFFIFATFPPQFRYNPSAIAKLWNPNAPALRAAGGPKGRTRFRPT